MKHQVNVVGLTGINISASRAISDIELEEHLTSNGVKLDMDNMWLGDEIRQVFFVDWILIFPGTKKVKFILLQALIAEHGIESRSAFLLGLARLGR